MDGTESIRADGLPWVRANGCYRLDILDEVDDRVYCLPFSFFVAMRRMGEKVEETTIA